MRNSVQIIGLLVLLCVLTSFFTPGNKDRWPRRWATVDTTVYNRNGEIIEVKLDIHYFHKDSILDLYDFRGSLKTIYKGKKYKIKPRDVEKLEFMLFNKKHTFYSYTDKLQRLFYFFHAENEGDLRLLSRKVNIPKGGPGIMGMPDVPLVEQAGIIVGLDLGGEYYSYSLVRNGEAYITDIETGRLHVVLEKYLSDCPKLIGKLNEGYFNMTEKGRKTRQVERIHRIIEYYNVTCGNIKLE